MIGCSKAPFAEELRIRGIVSGSCLSKELCRVGSLQKSKNGGNPIRGLVQVEKEKRSSGVLPCSLLGKCKGLFVSVHRALSTHTVILEASRVHYQASNWDNEWVLLVSFSCFRISFQRRVGACQGNISTEIYALALGEKAWRTKTIYPRFGCGLLQGLCSSVFSSGLM